MQNDRELDGDDLREKVCAAYLITPERMEFVPKGEASWCYRLETGGRGDPLFVKVHCRPNVDRRIFDVLHLLGNKHRVSPIVAPLLTTQGSASMEWRGHVIAVFPWLNGTNWSDTSVTVEDAVALGRMMADVHASAPSVPFPTREDFAESFRRGLQEVADASTAERRVEPLVETFRATYQLLLDRIFEEMTRLEEIGARLAGRKVSSVNTHGDAHGGNVFRTLNRLYLIDWHFPLLAPKERDLRFFCDRSWFPDFMRGYARTSEDGTIDEDALEYYRLNWTVSEAWDWGRRMLLEKQDVEHQKHYLDMFRGFIEQSGLQR
jgi:spectinomycin phosphotransferase